jgi:hypothetical protein
VVSHIDRVKQSQIAHALRTLRPSGSYRAGGRGPAPASTTAATSVDPIAVETEPIVTIGRRDLLGTGSGIASRFA